MDTKKITLYLLIAQVFEASGERTHSYTKSNLKNGTVICNPGLSSGAAIKNQLLKRI